MEKSHCSYCHTSSTRVFDLSNFPIESYPLEIRDLENVHFASSSLWYCKECFVGYLDPPTDPKILEEFYSKLFEYPDLDEDIDQHLINCIKSMGEAAMAVSSIVDVGGNNTHFLNKIRNKFKSCTLFDPSVFSEKTIIGEKINYINAFLDKDSAINYASAFDVVVCRHVIEHVKDPKEFLDNLLSLLKPEGTLFLETPNMNYLISTGNTRVIHMQHLWYLNTSSIIRWLADQYSCVILNEPTSMNLILKITPNSNREKLISVPNTPQSINDFMESFYNRKNRLSNIISKEKNLNRKCWIWGASSLANQFFTVYGLKPESFQGIIDSDQSKHGKILPCAKDLKITSYEEALQQGCNFILIAAPKNVHIPRQIGNLHSSVKFCFFDDV